MECSNCHEMIRPGAIICQVCGSRLPGPAPAATGVQPFDRSHWQPLPPAPVHRETSFFWLLEGTELFLEVPILFPFVVGITILVYIVRAVWRGIHNRSSASGR